jgi:hypothetical protein
VQHHLIEEEPDLPTENTNPVNTCPDFLITEEEVKDQLDILNCTKLHVHN